MIVKIFILCLLCYLIGSFPTGLIIGKTFFKTDIRLHGSKNIGGTNAGRVFGKRVGLFVSVFDILKIFIPVFVSKRYLGEDYAAVVGFFGLLGHSFPIFLKFKGGKGVSSYLGIVFALNFLVGITCAIIWKILKHLTNYVSIASIITCFVSSFFFAYLYGFGICFYMLLTNSLFIIFLHRENLKRLARGTENKVKK